jgi:WD40 repeat protein
MVEDWSESCRPRPLWLGFSSDGKWLAARYRVGNKARVRIWSVGEWKSSEKEFDAGGDFLLRPACVFDSTRNILYVADAGQLYEFSLPLKDPPKTKRLPVDGKVTDASQSLTLLADNKTLMITTCDSDVGVRFDRCPLESPDATTLVHSAKTKFDHFPAFTGNGHVFAAGRTVRKSDGNLDHGIEVWSTVTGKKIEQFGGIDDFRSAQFSNDGRYLATGCGDGTFALRDLHSGKKPKIMVENYGASCIDFHPELPLLAFCTYDRAGDVNMRIVDIPNWKALASLSVDIYSAHQVRFSPDGKRVAAVGSECIVRIWELDRLIKK